VRRAALALALLARCALAAAEPDAPETQRVAPAPPLIGGAFAASEQRLRGAAGELMGTTDSDGFRSGRLGAGALIRHESAYDFAALGGMLTRYRQGDWTADRTTLGGNVKNVERATGAGYAATGGVSEVGGRVRAVLDASWNVRLAPGTGIEVIGQRDFVETRAGLDIGATSNFAAVAVDHAATSRLTLIGLAGVQYYSDDNRRGHLRGRAIYSVMPEEGLSVQVRARGYDSTRAGGALYFNPDTYREADAGLRLRRSLGDWRVLAAAGAGREKFDGPRQPTSYFEARAERSFVGNTSLLFSYTYDRSSASDNAGGGSYRWQYFRTALVVPL
jgi:hypothetical protein